MCHIWWNFVCKCQSYSKEAPLTFLWTQCINYLAVTVLKPKTENRGFKVKPKRNRWGHVTVFLEFQKWPSPVTNVPKQQPNYRLSRTHASTVWSDQLTAPSGVARQPNYSPWQLTSQPLCCCRRHQDWRRTYRWIPSHADKYVNGGGESRLIDAHVSMRDRHDYYSLQLKKKHVIHPMQINIEKKLL